MTTINCPNCGRSIPAGSAFCPDCGFKLNESDPVASRLVNENETQLRRQRRTAYNWQQRLIPNLIHLKQVGRFMVNNGGFLLITYAATLILNQWRWEILGLFLLTSYLFPLLTGQETFRRTQRHLVNHEAPGHQQSSEPDPLTRIQPEPRVQKTTYQQPPVKQRRRHFTSNSEFRTGSIMIIPSFVCYLIARQVITRRGIQVDQIFNQISLGPTAYIYFISLGLLGISTAMVLGGLVKSITHHQTGGQRSKRWGIVIAAITILLAIAMYQNAVTATSAGAIASAVGAFLMPFLPWIAAICYGIGIIKNIITPQRL
ncbi:zinc ribbon domain-containing protein [Secundilactobacillus yichangensis]|uniref:zinc ribbon domain-containing protein n=1 Tax=Secundilactobacillus yichangensis TaxID=2799580 RepID=UPI00194329CA|nr:zinc ribbon domain-containing protein [Secundilactobacillus yichangensis]